MWLFLIFVFTVAYCAYFAFTLNFSYWKKRGVPHPPFSSLFGNVKDAILLKKSMGQTYHDIYTKYSSLPYVGGYKLRTPFIIIQNTELIKDILQKSFSSFHQNDSYVDETNDKLIALNPFFVKNLDQWKSSRAQIMPSFTNKQMKFNFPLIESVCKKLVSFLENPKIANGGIDVKELCQKFTMDVVASCVMGLEANSFLSSNSDFVYNIRKVISPDTITNIKLSLFFFLPGLAKLLKIRLIPKDVADYFKGIINETIAYRIKNKVERNDVLNMMQELQLKLGKEAFTEDHVAANILSFFLDGFETSSVVLSFALYELGANQHYQIELREEIKTTLKKNDGQLNFESMQEMKFLSKVINETLRLHPPAMMLGKVCTKPYQLPPLHENGKGIVLEPGLSVIIPIYSLQTDSRYFADPFRFDPERFSEDNSYDRFTFLPFGEGPRMCIGQKFALTQIKLAVIHVVLNYEISVNKKMITPIEIDPGYFLKAAKGGIWLNFVKRQG